MLAAARCVRAVLEAKGYRGITVRLQLQLRGWPTRNGGMSACSAMQRTEELDRQKTKVQERDRCAEESGNTYLIIEHLRQEFKDRDQRWHGGGHAVNEPDCA